MSELIRELFERHKAKLLNLDYEQLKQQFDRHEECFNKRYATFSCFEKEFNVWEACWNDRQSEIDQLKAEKEEVIKLAEKWMAMVNGDFGLTERLTAYNYGSELMGVFKNPNNKNIGG